MNKKKLTFIQYSAIILYGLLLVIIMRGSAELYGSQVDWFGQHIVFPDTFRQAFYESGNLIPNFLFRIGGGQNAFMFTYYGFLSPFVLISYLLPFIDMTVYMICASIIIYISTGILTKVFLKKHFNELSSFAGAIIMLSVAPVSFHFHHHIMFVWYLPFLIISMMGLDRYFDKRKWGLFVVSTFFLILTNYYFAVSSLVCLFVYAVYRILKDNPSGGKVFCRKLSNIVCLFALPVLLSAFVLFPTAYALLANSRPNAVVEETKNLFLTDLPDYILAKSGIGLSGLMVVAFIGNLTSSKRTKASCFLNGIMLFMIVCPLIPYALNGFLYVRGKVLIPFIIIAIYCLCSFIDNLKSNNVNLKITVIVTISLFALVSLISLANFLLGLFVLVALICVVIIKNKPEFLYMITLIPLLAVSLISGIVDEKFVDDKFYDSMYLDEIENLTEMVDEGLYRTNVSLNENHLGNRIFGDKFYGTSVYSSTSNQVYQNFYETYMGNNEAFRNCFIVAGAKNELFYTFMGTRYIIADSDPGFLYEKVAESEHLALYKNSSAYPLVYKSLNTISEADFNKINFPYSAGLLMTNTVVPDGNSSIKMPDMKKCEVLESYRFINEKEEEYVITLDDKYINHILYLSFDIVNEGDYLNKKDISITINGIENKLTAYTWQYYNGNTRFDYVIPLENTSDLKIKVSKGNFNIDNLSLYISDVLTESYTEVNDLKIDLRKNNFSCTVNSEGEDYLVTSIPYDEGFSATINGRSVPVETVNTAFVGLKLEKGENHIVIKYTSPLFHAGILVSMIGVMLMVCIMLRDKLLLIFNKYREVIMYLIIGGLTTVVSLVTYYLCTSFFLDAYNAVQLQIANVISWVVSVAFAYVTNKILVFRSTKAIGSEIGQFCLSRIGTLLMDIAMMYVMVTLAGLNDMLSKTIVQVVVIVANYVLSKFFVFKEENTK